MISTGAFGRRGAADPQTPALTRAQTRAQTKALARAQTQALARAEVRGPMNAPGAPAKRGAADLAAPAEEEARASLFPLVTLGLLTLLTAVFLGEQAFGFDPGATQISYHGLIALGAVDRDLALGQGQVWRLLTAPLLHGGVDHLAGNAAVLALVGFGLERLIGRAWFAAIFAAGGLASAVASAAWNRPWVPSVGASGAIMALLTATFVCSFHPEAHEDGPRMRRWVYFLAIPALFPFGARDGHVDYSAHMGGALAGMALGYLLQYIWSQERALPPLRRQAAVAALSLAGAAGLAFALVALNYPAYAERQEGLIPDAVAPEVTDEALESSATLVLEYPHDPLAHLLRAAAAAKLGDVPMIEAQARAGLAERDRLARDYPPPVALELRGLLAISLLAQNRTGEARPLALAVCADEARLQIGDQFTSYFRQAQLCA